MAKAQDGGAGNTQSSARINIIRKMMPDSLNGKSYSKNTQENIYIVIHNTAGGTASTNTNYFHNGADGRNVSTHYVIDDKEVYQLLENNWKGHHCGDTKDANHKNSPMSNSNTIGIEVADGDTVDHNKAIEVVIELTRYLMKEMNIDVDHVVRHHDVTGKQCPGTIMKLNKWDYIKSEIKKRNDSGQTIELDTSKLSSSGSSGSSGSGGSSGNGGGGSSNVIDILPNVDHRYNIANMDEVRGACIIFYPPYNTCEMGARDENFKKWGWNRKYHYIIDHSYNVDEAPPEDDIPEITECIPESSGSNGTEGGGNTEGGTNNGNGGTVGDGTNNGGGQLGDDDLEFASISIKSLPTLENTVFIGDLLTVGLKDNITGLKAYATEEHTIQEGKKEYMADIKKEISANYFVLSYGTNDAEYEQPEKFKDNYIEFINELKTALPNAKFFINKIFPGNSDAPDCNDKYKKIIERIPSHNDVLPEVCTATGAKLLDCVNYIRDYKDYYMVDGIHFTADFYPIWKDAMLTSMGNNNDTGENGGTVEQTPSGGTWTTPNVETPDTTEDNCITIKGGFEKIDNRLLQCYGLEDNDKVTYINRALFNGKVTKHTIMIACFIPSYEDLEKAKITYEQVEKNIVNSVSKILWANGLNTKDLWREFDMNRAPSPAIYLDRDKWKDLLTEIDKVLEWRNKKFGVVSTTYEKYVATISEYIHTGNSAGVTPSEPGTGGTMNSDNEVVKIVYETLTGLGLTAQAACAILGNMYQESTWRPDVVNSKGASGLCQWRLERLTGLKNYAKSKGKEWTDVKTQAEWAWMEAEGKDPTTKSKLKGMCGGPEGFKKLTDIEKATVVWRKAFERCGEAEANDARRISAAKECYSKVSGGTSTASINNNMLVNIKSKGTLSWPCPSCKSISSPYGPRNIRVPGASKNHKGIDIPCGSGSDVVAAAAGKVAVVSSQSARGNYVVIDHGNGLGTLYQHLSRATVSVGNSVQANQTIAKSGATGVGSGPHLHFEVHENFSGTKGTPVNPENYVSPGTAHGSISGDGSGGSSDGGGDSSGGGGGTGWTSIDGPLVNSPHGDIVNPGPAANLPYSGNSMGGLDHDDWGGKTTYKAGEPEDPEAEKPEIENVFSSEEYEAFCERFFVGENFAEDGTFSYATNFKKYWELIDIYAADFEPYDKGLVDENSVAITPSDRLNALTTNFTSDNENTFHFNVVESGPGSSEHCVKSADELNVIVVPEDLKIEPIYPDLIIPPHYSTTDYDTNSPNTVPLNMIETIEATDSGLLKQIHFDYQLLKEKKKETNKCSGPINFLDPYPTDDKIQELEAHYPKIFIDEIESQMYSCNHPGCPIAQPMAKNFAMLQDAIMNQSKRVEKRVSKLENILSTIMRNQARLGSRVNINCVYYGGQSTLAGKYKCIRCLHDDRVHDGAIVTIDQCLNCTRYEPILGQIYQILDETGLNGSIILDDMQMSYSDLYAFQQLNTGTERSAKYDYVEVTGDKNVLKPEKTLQELWLEANKEVYLKKSENITMDEEDKKENENKDESGAEIAVPADTVASIQTIENSAKKEIANIKEADYVFRMDWRETYFNHQEPDVKTYPLEGIIARYKKADADLDYETYLAELDPELDKDIIEDVQREMALVEGEWVDTREQAETIQVNKYSSEKFYFDGFAEMKTTVGAAGENGIGGSGSTGFGAECRAKITEMASKIVADHDAGKAKYCQSPRTVDYTKPQSSGGKVCYDCTSMVSCCYLHAGLKSMYDKSCSGGSLMAEICNNGGEMWLLNDAGLSKAKPGDVVIKANSKVSEADMQAKKKVGCSHAMIYMGDGSIAHASSPSAGIKKEDLKSSFRWKDGKHFFVRPKDLIDADAAAASSGNGGGASEATGTIDGKNYVATIQGAVCTSYYGGGGSASGIGLENGKTCASHNMPYGTKLYIPSLKGKLGTDGIITVTDTGGPLFDFDIYTNKGIGKVNADVYVISWGDGKVAPSYTWGLNFYSDSQWNGLKSAWNKYKSMNGKLMSFLKFSQEDANIKNHKRY